MQQLLYVRYCFQRTQFQMFMSNQLGAFLGELCLILKKKINWHIFSVIVCTILFSKELYQFQVL